MPLALTCPHCQRTVVVPAADAGKVVRCTECQAEFEAPPVAQAVEDENEPAQRISTTGIPVSAWQALTDDLPPTDDDPPTNNQLHYGAPAQSNRDDWETIVPSSASHPPLEPGWDRVSSGLGFIGKLTLASLALTYFSSCLSLLATEGAGLAGVLSTGFALIGSFLYLLALYEVCSIPHQSGVRGLTHATAWTTAAGVVLVGLGALLIFLNSFRSTSYRGGFRSEDALFTALSGVTIFLGSLLLIIGSVLFIFVLRGIAHFFGERRLAQNLMLFFYFLILTPITGFMGFFCLLAMLDRGNKRGAPEAFITLFIYLFATTLLSIWLYNLLRDVRRRIDFGRSHNNTADFPVGELQ